MIDWARPILAPIYCFFGVYSSRMTHSYGKPNSVLLRFLIGIAFALIATPSLALSTPKLTCDQAAKNAAAQTGVPLAILWSITRTETGRQRNSDLQPWPWTVNMEGTGRWFETEDAAKNYVTRHFKRGARSFDVGCFQINYKWHGHSFKSIEHMFDPLENALYAAELLKRHFRETGDWTVAAGNYHSRTPEHAKRYKVRFSDILKRYKVAYGASQIDAGPSSLTRENTYPLLQQSNSENRYGSLVPLSMSRSRAMFSIPRLPGGS